MKESNWPLVGNSHIIEYLEKTIINNAVRGPYIFNGPDNLGKTTLACSFAQNLFCKNKKENSARSCNSCETCHKFKKASGIGNEDEDEDENLIDKYTHSDFYVLNRQKDKKNISIGQIRDFIDFLSLSSFLNSYKIGIIKNADSLSIEAANALLKTLEEPKKNVIIILITHSLENLPPTIISRSQALNFYPVDTDTIYEYLIAHHGATRSQAKHFSRLCGGRPALAVKFLQNSDFYSKYMKGAQAFVDFFQQDINGRFQILNSLIEGSPAPQILAKNTKRILESWQSVLRDMLLLNCGQRNLIQHEIMEKDLLAAKSKITANDIIGLEKLIKEAKIAIDANANPKLTLENIAIKLNII